MNLPPSLRHVPHVGMHMAGFDLGAYCSLDVFSDELMQLWDPGFVVDGQKYKVFLIEILTDSRGREKLMKVQGAGSHAGCSKCDFPGRTFARTCVYDGWRRYLSAGDIRRNKMNGIRSLLQYHCEERAPPPQDRTYAFYKTNGTAAIENNGEPSNGVKGLFAFHRHPLAHLITATTDYMHAFYNVIHDLIR